MLDQHRRTVQVIDGHVEVALNLRRVKIKCQSPARSGGLQEIGDELRRNWYARLVLPILPRIAVVRQHRGDTPGGRALESIDHQQQLDQMTIHPQTAPLEPENV